jgi:hypothetical protein
MEIMDCSICGGAFLEDYGKCTCDGKKIQKLEKELRLYKKKYRDMCLMFYAGMDGDVEDLPKRLQKEFIKMTEGI